MNKQHIEEDICQLILNEPSSFLLINTWTCTYKINAIGGFNKSKHHKYSTRSNPVNYESEIFICYNNFIIELIEFINKIFKEGVIHIYKL